MEKKVDGMDLSEFPPGVSLAKFTSDDDWWDTIGDVLGHPWTTTKRIYTLVTDLRNKDDSKDKDKVLHNEDDASSIGGSEWDVEKDASLFGDNHPEILV